MNDEGDYFPLWGTCLGFELLNLLAAKNNWMKLCSAEDLASNINFVEGILAHCFEIQYLNFV